MKIADRLKKHILVDENAVVIDLKKSQGSWIVDEETGKQYMDCFSQFASQPLGWNHPKVVAQKDRLLDAAISKVANSDMYTKEYVEFVEKFAEFTPDHPYHFYVSGGALGVENALKAAFDWKYQKYGKEDMDVIHLENCFHGRSGYTMSLTNNGDPDNPKVDGYPKFEWTRILNPKINFPILDDANYLSDLERREKTSLDQAEAALKNRNVAAIIIEPIQGEGGDNHFRDEYLVGLRQLADQYEAMLIFDEVQAGVGLTGEFWAYQNFSVVPDMISFGKKMQTCGFAASDRITTEKNNVFTVPSRINSTWGGNIVDMVRSTMYLEIIEEDDLVNNAKSVGNHLLSRLEAMGLDNARGKGLWIAFDHPNRDQVISDLFDKGMFVLSCGSDSIRLRPHLDFSVQDADLAADLISQVV